MDGLIPSSEQSINHHVDFWFEGGNIVLLAEGTGFKVHRSVLAKHSTVFKDLFLLASPSANETLDGVPVVTLHDSSHELADLLGAIYNGSRFFGKAEQKHNFLLIQSLLRLGTKYQVEELRDEAFHYLDQILPADMNLWDQAEKDPSVVYDSADIISMVNLTSELDLGPMHLRALYKCCQLPTRFVVQGIDHPRGRQQLSSKHAIICLDGRMRLTNSKRSMMEDMTWFWDQGQCDLEDRECKAHQRALAKRRHSAIWVLDANPLQSLETWLRDIDFTEGYGSPGRLCVLCLERQMKFIQMRRIRIYGRLKDFFEAQ